MKLTAEVESEYRKFVRGEQKEITPEVLANAPPEIRPGLERRVTTRKFIEETDRFIHETKAMLARLQKEEK